MRGEALPVAGEGDIDEALLLPEALEARGNVVKEAVPLEAYLT